MGLGNLFKRRREHPPRSASRRTSAPASAPVRAARGRANWVPAGGSFVVDGREVNGGMVYVGSRAASVDGSQIEPCLIDPRLPISWRRPDYAGHSMSYWPSFSYVDKGARAAYLTWLIGGRKDPSAYIGYVFLFFYGLERRLLADLWPDLDHPEVEILTAEIERLLGIYRNNRSFAGYAGQLLDHLEALRLVDANLQPVPWNPDRQHWEVPNALRIGIGRFVAAGLRIPAEWALSYLRHHPEVALRIPAKRCQSEFDQLFLIRYRARFGEGIKLRRPKKNLELSYWPASGGFRSTVSLTMDGIPDITSVIGPINKLKDLAAECTDELDGYSRFLGRRPDEAATAAAIALLPDDLLATHGGPLLDDLRDWAAHVLGDESSAVAPLDELVQRWSPGRVEKLAKRDAVSLATLLGKIGVGIEPDVRFGASTPRPASDVVLFRLPEGSSAAPSAAYTAAMSLVHLTAVVAAADGVVSEAEQQHLSEHAEQVLGLDAGECARLEAHLRFLAAGAVGLAGVKRKVEALPAGERAAVGSFLIDVAAADGVISPEEISTLTKLYVRLGLDEADVYRQVHALATGDRGPMTVRRAEPTTRWAVPDRAEDAMEPAAAVLDQEKVQARLAETARVAALLTDIFADDEDSVMPVSSPDAGEPIIPHAEPGLAPESTMWGLDPAHSALAVALADQVVWTRIDVEELAESLGLPLLEGALDVINEAAMDGCGEPLVEGDDPLELNAYAIEEMSE